MQFKVDENLPAEVCNILHEAGHDAMSVLDQKLGGRPDDEICSVCRSEARALVTLDTDFADIITYPPASLPGIVVIRAGDQAKPSVLSLVRSFVAALPEGDLHGQLWIVERDRVRVRGGE
jgi:predicted nuclease of predicted toxin-antitoxin system